MKKILVISGSPKKVDLERSFILMAEYTGMQYASLLIPDAGESGEIVQLLDAREKAVAFGRQLAQ